MPYGTTPHHQMTPAYGAQTAPVSPQRQQQQQPFAQSPVVGGQIQPPSGAGRMPYPQQGYAPYPQQPQAQQGMSPQPHQSYNGKFNRMNYPKIEIELLYNLTICFSFRAIPIRCT
jgi:hypothetical protein